jgi:hypothetical protein
MEFPKILGQIIVDFEYKYHNVHSLQEIVDKINSLSVEEKIKYNGHIFLILSKIEDCVKNNKRLTDEKDTNIFNTIKGRYNLLKPLDCGEREFEAFLSREENTSNNEKDILEDDFAAFLPREEKFTNHNGVREKEFENDFTSFLAKEKKFEPDDIYMTILSNLINNLNRDVMGSSLTNYIIEYFEVVHSIMETEPDKYLEITSEVVKWLGLYGWNNDRFDGSIGFQTEPDRIGLADNLTTIMTSHLKF